MKLFFTAIYFILIILYIILFFTLMDTLKRPLIKKPNPTRYYIYLLMTLMAFQVINLITYIIK